MRDAKGNQNGAERVMGSASFSQDESVQPTRNGTRQRELFTSADLVQSLCRLHDEEYLREVVVLLQEQLTQAAEPAASSKAA